MSSQGIRGSRNWSISTILLAIGGVAWALFYILESYHLLVTTTSGSEMWWASIKLAWRYIFYYLLLLAVALLSELAMSRWRQIRVFISYQHDHEATATEMKEALGAQGYEVFMMSFEPRQHDATIAAVHDRLRRADVLVAIPGEEPSWMDNEIGIASYAGKGVVIVEHLPEQRIPDVSYEGYPRFLLDRLRNGHFEPLVKFVNCAMRRVSIVVPGFVVSAVGGALAAYILYMQVMLGISVLALLISLVMLVISFDFAGKILFGFAIFKIWLFMTSLCILLPIGVYMGVSSWLVAARVLRQSMRTRSRTALILAAQLDNIVGLDRDVVSALVGGDKALKWYDLHREAGEG